jgi:Mg-chelatase subunit ChlD
MSVEAESRLHRWRLLLGAEAADCCEQLSSEELAIDQALARIYGGAGSGSQSGGQRGGSAASAPWVSRWLGDIRQYFPSQTVRILQKDALERLQLQQLLLEPEMLESVELDVQLVANLLALRSVIPDRTKDTARQVVRKVVEEIQQRVREPLRAAVSGALNRAERRRTARPAAIDWTRTIKANLQHYQAEYQSIIPEQIIGYGRKGQQCQRQVIVCIDQSGSMASSVVYASIFGAVMASLPAISTQLVVFDTAVVDLTPQLSDPVDLLFGVQLGGGTDINQALAYCQGLIREPQNTIFVLISDLFEGGFEKEFLGRANDMIQSGVQFVSLLALSDEGAPAYNAELGKSLASLGAPAFACTPDAFPDLIACAIRKEDLAAWAARASEHALASG